MKIRVIGLAIFTLFLLLAAGLFYLQIIKGPLYQNLATLNRIRLVPIEGPRGRLFDRNGALLVDNRISFNVAVIPQELKNRSKIFQQLKKRLNIREEKFNESLKDNFAAPFRPIKVISDISREEAIMLEEESLDLPGVLIETAPRRRYIYGKYGSHIFGYLGEINKAELTRLKTYGYRMSDLIGKSGLEESYDNYLKGSHGGKQVEVNNLGYQVGILGFREPVKGRDLYLTIDIRLQEFIEALVEGARAAVCVMDPRDGQVLSLVSSPSFDPNLFLEEENSLQVKGLLTSKDYPLLNRATQCGYPPGSVFKVVTASAAVDTGRITEHTTLSCSGSYFLGNKEFKCWKSKGHGTQTIREAIKNSCNVFFYQLGRKAGVEDLANYAARFGFGHPTGIDILKESSGLVPSKMWKALKMARPWYEGETVNYAIGQGYLLVTPMQILRMMAAVSNNGYLVKPYIVKKVDEVDISQVKKRPLNVSKETLDIIKDGLIKVVNESDGTGRRAYVEGVSIAGKTGTAQTTEIDKTHAWFAGFAPVEEPKAALVIFLEYGGKGGLGASETAGKIFAKMRDLGYL